MDVLVLSPVYDIATYMAGRVANRVYRFARGRGYDAEMLVGGHVNLVEFWAALERGRPKLVVYCGHGERDHWGSGIPFVSTLSGFNAGWVRGGGCVAQPACLTAQELGREVVEKGCRVYIGNVTEVFVALPEPDHRYDLDFEESFFTVYREVLSGNSFSEAVERYKEVCDEYLSTYENSDWVDADFYAELLRNNRDAIALYGDGDATIKDLEPIDPQINWGAVFLGLSLPLVVAAYTAPLVVPWAVSEAKKRGWVSEEVAQKIKGVFEE